MNKLVLLQPDVIKLDKELVQALPDRVSRAVIDAVVQMTHSYGGLVLAECVETLEQAQAATNLGVDLGRGWLFGRPERQPVHVRSTTIDAADRPLSQGLGTFQARSRIPDSR